MAAADYDRDGDLDIYACRYYQADADPLALPVPTPYFDAQNGGENYLIQNEGNWRTTNATIVSGLDQNNNRFSYAAIWIDFDQDGDQDLYVANGYITGDKSPDDLDRNRGHAIWLNLWASWCVPCLEELQQVTARADDLRAAGVQVIALSLDGFNQPGTESTNLGDARKRMEQLKFPFESAVALPETIRRLQFADRQVFGRESELVLPMSYLLSATGELAAIYRGPVSVDRVRQLRWRNNNAFQPHWKSTAGPWRPIRKTCR